VCEISTWAFFAASLSAGGCFINYYLFIIFFEWSFTSSMFGEREKHGRWVPVGLIPVGRSAFGRFRLQSGLFGPD